MGHKGNYLRHNLLTWIKLETDEMIQISSHFAYAIYFVMNGWPSDLSMATLFDDL